MSNYYVLNATRQFAQHEGDLMSCVTYIRNSADLFGVSGLVIAERDGRGYRIVSDRIVDADRGLVIPFDNVDEDGWIIGIPLICGHVLPNREGEQAFNYYDMEAFAIARPASVHDAEYDTSGRLPHGVTYWFRTDEGNSLDGSRTVCHPCAREKGYRDHRA